MRVTRISYLFTVETVAIPDEHIALWLSLMCRWCFGATLFTWQGYIGKTTLVKSVNTSRLLHIAINVYAD